MVSLHYPQRIYKVGHFVAIGIFPFVYYGEILDIDPEGVEDPQLEAMYLCLLPKLTSSLRMSLETYFTRVSLEVKYILIKKWFLLKIVSNKIWHQIWHKLLNTKAESLCYCNLDRRFVCSLCTLCIYPNNGYLVYLKVPKSWTHKKARKSLTTSFRWKNIRFLRTMNQGYIFQ